MRWSIRYRLFLPLGVVLLTMISASIWTARISARQAEQRIGEQVRRVTQTLTGTTLSLTEPILRQMKGLSGAEYVFIDPAGDRLSTFLEEPDEIASFEESSRMDASIDSESLGNPVIIRGQRYRYRRVPQRSGGSLYIFYPEASLEAAIGDAIRPSLILGMCGVIGALTITLLFGSRLVRRIRELERRTRLIAQGDFSPMQLPTQRDELRDLAQSVNEMAGQLATFQTRVQEAERYRLLSQLASGLAHQLRNSVTGARLALQVHATECPVQDREAFMVIFRQLSLMDANLQRFMDLGKPEEQVSGPCGIGQLINDALQLLGAQAQHAGVDITWIPPERDIILQGDSGKLGHLFLNVIGNAIEAATPGGNVEIRLTRQSDTICVEIYDSGPGPRPEIAPRLFEPFVTGKPEGIGLGLAVAKQAAAAHGGTINWQRINDRTCFRITFPG